jgi:hypothetical protein
MHISVMVTKQVSAHETRYIKDAYRHPGFIPYSRLEKVEITSSTREFRMVTLWRRGKKDSLRRVRNDLPKLVRSADQKGQGSRLWTLRYISPVRTAQGGLSGV